MEFIQRLKATLSSAREQSLWLRPDASSLAFLKQSSTHLENIYLGLKCFQWKK